MTEEDKATAEKAVAEKAAAEKPVTENKKNTIDRVKQDFITHPVRFCLVALMVLIVIYWLILAPNRFVSEAKIIVSKTDIHMSGGLDLPAMFMGANLGANDLRLLREYLKTPELIEQLDSDLALRKHYSQSTLDPFSKLWSKDATTEDFVSYASRRISVEIDEQPAILVIKVQAYQAKMAQQVVRKMMQYGEKFLNNMGHELSKTQVEFLQQQVKASQLNAQSARKQALVFQNEYGLISPEAKIKSSIGVVANIEAQITSLEAQRIAAAGYLNAKAPQLMQLNNQIAALKKQLQREKNKLTTENGNSLNATMDAYVDLEVKAELAQSIYKMTLVALEKGQVEASRMLKKLSVIQQPSLPQQATEPRRLYQIVLFLLMLLIATGFARLVKAIIDDHKD